jgi:uncharacterized membrane protein
MNLTVRQTPQTTFKTKHIDLNLILMKKTNIIYWISTGFLAFGMGMSGITNLASPQDWAPILEQLGYPQYLGPFLGVAKILGAIAVLIPGFPRLKEWAYAGLFFDLLGATYSALYMQGFQPPMLFMLIYFGFLALSYVYHHKRLAYKGTQQTVAVA